MLRAIRLGACVADELQRRHVEFAFREDVAAEVNAKMAAATPVSRLRDMWTTVSRQAGARTSLIRQRAVTQAGGHVTVVNVGPAAEPPYSRTGDDASQRRSWIAATPRGTRSL